MLETVSSEIQKWCKYCDEMRSVDDFQPQRLKCRHCVNEDRRKAVAKSQKRQAYFREYQARLRASARLLPGMLAAVRAMVDGNTERAERLAKAAYEKAVQEGIA